MQQHYLEWPLMTGKTGGTLAILITLLVASVPATCQCLAHPLTVAPAAIDVRATSVLEALVDFGQTNSVCFGIEVTDGRLAATGVDWHQAAPLRDLLESALSHVDGYRFGVRDHIVSISPARAGVPTWLDVKIPEFSAKHRADVQSINNLLFMDLVLVENPHHGGFAGDYLGADPQDQIGPLDERGQSVRSLLDLIVASSKGGIWITAGRYDRSRVLSNQPFWRVLEYSQPLPTNLGRMAGVVREIQSVFGSPKP
jgi:hypothetical protein